MDLMLFAILSFHSFMRVFFSLLLSAHSRYFHIRCFVAGTWLYFVNMQRWLERVCMPSRRGIQFPSIQTMSTIECVCVCVFAKRTFWVCGKIRGAFSWSITADGERESSVQIYLHVISGFVVEIKGADTANTLTTLRWPSQALTIPCLSNRPIVIRAQDLISLHSSITLELYYIVLHGHACFFARQCS